MEELLKKVMDQLEEKHNLVLSNDLGAHENYEASISAKLKVEDEIARDLQILDDGKYAPGFTLLYFKEIYTSIKKLILALCKEESFAKKYLDNEKSLVHCGLRISGELQDIESHGTNDLEIYKKAIDYFVPDGEVKAIISVTFEDKNLVDCIDGAHPVESIEFNKPKPKQKVIPENIRNKKKIQNTDAIKTNTVQASLFELL